MINPSASPIRIMQPGSSLLGRSEVTRTPGILLPKQARYQLRYTPKLYYFFCPLALLARLAVPEKILALSACSIFSTAARAPPRCIRHRRRSASHPKVQALPTALHPDIFSFVLVLPVARLPCSPGLRSPITPTVYWIFRRKSTAGAPFLPAAKSKGKDLLRSLSLREMFCGFTGGNYLASTSAMWPMRSSSLLL